MEIPATLAIPSPPRGEIGTDLADTRDAEPASRVHSHFSLVFTSSEGTFKLRSSGGANNTEFEATKTITWVVNNTDTPLSYVSPKNQEVHTVAPDSYDFWAGTWRVFDGVVSSSPNNPITDIKFTFTNGPAPSPWTTSASTTRCSWFLSRRSQARWPSLLLL